MGIWKFLSIILVISIVFGFSYSYDITSCQVINNPGYYNVTNDLYFNDLGNTETDCLLINSSNVIINGNGHSIYSNYSGVGITGKTIGIKSVGFNNITIKNFYIKGPIRLVFKFLGGKNIRIYNITVNVTRYMLPDYFVANGVTNLTIINSTYYSNPEEIPSYQGSYGGNYYFVANSRNVILKNVYAYSDDKNTEPWNILVWRSENVTIYNMRYFSEGNNPYIGYISTSKVFLYNSQIKLINSNFDGKFNMVLGSNITLYNTTINGNTIIALYNETINNPLEPSYDGTYYVKNYNITINNSKLSNLKIFSSNIESDYRGILHVVNSNITQLTFGNAVLNTNGSFVDSYIGDISIEQGKSDSMFDKSNSWYSDNITTKYGNLTLFTDTPGLPPFPYPHPIVIDDIVYKGLAFLYNVNDNVTIEGKTIAFNSSIKGIAERPILLKCNGSMIDANYTNSEITDYTNYTYVNNTNKSYISYSNYIGINKANFVEPILVNNLLLNKVKDVYFGEFYYYNVFNYPSNNIMISNSNVSINGGMNSKVYNIDACNSTVNVNSSFEGNIHNSNPIPFEYPGKCCRLGLILEPPYYEKYVEKNDTLNVLGLYKNSTVSLYVDDNFIYNITTPYQLSPSNIPYGWHNITVRNGECVGGGRFYVAKVNHTLIFNRKVSDLNDFITNKSGYYDIVNNITYYNTDNYPSQIFFYNMDNLNLNYLFGSKVYQPNYDLIRWFRDKGMCNYNILNFMKSASGVTIYNVSNVVINNPTQWMTNYSNFNLNKYFSFSVVGDGENVTVNGGNIDSLEIIKCNHSGASNVNINGVNMYDSKLLYVYANKMNINNVNEAIVVPYVNKLYANNVGYLYLQFNGILPTHLYHVYANNIDHLLDSFSNDLHLSNVNKLTIPITSSYLWLRINVYGDVNKINIIKDFYGYLYRARVDVYLHNVKIGNANISGTVENSIISSVVLPHYDTSKFGYAKMWINISKGPSFLNWGNSHADICFNYNISGRDISIKKYNETSKTWSNIKYTVSNDKPCISVEPHSIYALFDNTHVTPPEHKQQQQQLPPKPKQDYTWLILLGIVIFIILLFYSRRKKKK